MREQNDEFPAVRTNLPARRTPFVGREEELGELEDILVAGTRLLTILGGPGVGKTRLATEVARRHLDAEPTDGVWFCDLSAARDRNDVTAALSRAIGISAESSASAETPARVVTQELARRGAILVVLDNFEQVVDAALETVGAWLAGAPQAQLVVTSRERLNIAGEVCRELAPPPLEQAIELFELHASARRRLDLDSPTERQMLHDIVERLDRVPLAIELAASRVGALSLAELRARLSERFDVLRTNRKDVPQRHSSLWTAIAWSWDMLSEWERRGLTQCVAFRGGFSIHAAEAILDLSAHDDAPEAIDVVQALVDRSLLLTSQAEDSAQLRFDMFESIRQYTTEHGDADELAAATERHTRYFLSEGELLALGYQSAEGATALRRIELELDNLIAAHQRAVDDRPDIAARIVCVIHPYVAANGLYRTHAGLLDAGVACAERAADAALEVQARWARSSLSGLVSDHIEDARSDFHRIEQLCATIDMPAMQANASMGLAALAYHACNWDAAVASWRDADGFFAVAGDPGGSAKASANLAIVALDRDELDRAELLYQRSFALSQGTDTRYVKAFPLLVGGAIAHARGDYESSRERYHASLEIARDVRPTHEAETLSHLGMLECECGEWGLAAHHLNASVDRYRAVGAPCQTGIPLAFLAAVEARLGKLDSARDKLAMAKPMLGEIEGLGGPVVYAAMAAFVEIVASRLDATDERDSSPTRPLGGDTPRTPPFIARVALRLFDDITAARDTAVTTTVAPDVIAIGPECRWFQVSGHERIHIGRRKLLRRLLARLVEHRTTTPNDPIGVAELIEHCWPNEALVKGSGTNRVYVAVSKLRKMGLSDILLTRGDGYLLDHLTEIRREDS